MPNLLDFVRTTCVKGWPIYVLVKKPGAPPANAGGSDWTSQHHEDLPGRRRLLLRLYGLHRARLLFAKA